MNSNYKDIDANIEYCDPFDEKHNYLMRLEHLGRYMWAKDIIQRNKYNNVLDVACSNGYGTKLLSSVCKNIIGIDNKKSYINYAKKNYNASNINYILKDVDKNNIEGLFDCIVCFETLEHLKYPESFLKNIYNILNNDGKLLISVPNEKYEIIENGKNKDTYHLHTFSYKQLLKIFNQNNFEIEKVLGQSITNKIINNMIENPSLTNNLLEDSKTVAYPNNEDIHSTYSYIFVLKKQYN